MEAYGGHILKCFKDKEEQKWEMSHRHIFSGKKTLLYLPTYKYIFPLVCLKTHAFVALQTHVKKPNLKHSSCVQNLLVPFALIALEDLSLMFLLHLRFYVKSNYLVEMLHFLPCSLFTNLS